MRFERTDDGVVVELNSEADTARLGAWLASHVTPGIVIGLVGSLGAGKTRLVRGIAEALGVDPRAVSSPTFVLIHEYEGVMPVYHFDAYRLASPEAFEALGAADYWDAGGVCLVEWANLVGEVLPESTSWIELTSTGPESRRARLVGPMACCIPATQTGEF